MDYFKKRENVDLYTSMMSEYDNSFLLSELEKVLPLNSTLLEIGMGSGLDLLSLSQKYRVIGSDNSELFISDFKAKSDLNVCVLDALTLEIDKTFDCIYSNKVLQHLTIEGFRISLNKQYSHLNDNGIIFTTLWHGVPREELMFKGQLRFVYYDKTAIEKIVPEILKIEKIVYYSEFEADDSMIVVLRKL